MIQKVYSFVAIAPLKQLIILLFPAASTCKNKVNPIIKNKNILILMWKILYYNIEELGKLVKNEIGHNQPSLLNYRIRSVHLVGQRNTVVFYRLNKRVQGMEHNLLEVLVYYQCR